MEAVHTAAAGEGVDCGGSAASSPGCLETAGAVLALQPALARIYGEARGIDLRQYELASTDRLLAELCPAVVELLRQAQQVLRGVIGECERESKPPDSGVFGSPHSSPIPFEVVVDATLEAHRGTFMAAEEVAAIAHLELRQREARLSRVTAARGSGLILAEADSSLRRTRKALSAVDQAIADAWGVLPLLEFSAELDTSLAVRRAYARFRDRMSLPREPDPGELRARIRAAGTQIAMLIGWEIYAEFRIRDRLLLRELQARLLDWLRAGEQATAREGLQLWQDLAACLEMFSLVNRRQEIVEHDRATLGRILEALRADPQDGHGDAWRMLLRLEGLDPALDQLIASQPRPSAAAALPLLQALSGGFLGRSPGAAGEGAVPW